MFEYFPSWTMLLNYLPIVVIISLFLVLPLAAGGCYALVQGKDNPSSDTNDQTKIKAHKQLQQVSIGRNAINLTLGLYCISLLLIFYIVLFCNTSIGKDDFHEVNSFLNSNKIILSGETYSIPSDIQEKRQILYEVYVKDNRLTQIEFLTLRSEVSEMVKNRIKTTHQSPNSEPLSSVIYPMVNKERNLSL